MSRYLLPVLLTVALLCTPGLLLADECEETCTPFCGTITAWECPLCFWIYWPQDGDPGGNIPPGTLWEDLPQDWSCPVCATGKYDFGLYDSWVISCAGYAFCDEAEHTDPCETAVSPIFSCVGIPTITYGDCVWNSTEQEYMAEANLYYNSYQTDPQSPGQKVFVTGVDIELLSIPDTKDLPKLDLPIYGSYTTDLLPCGSKWDPICISNPFFTSPDPVSALCEGNPPMPIEIEEACFTVPNSPFIPWWVKDEDIFKSQVVPDGALLCPACIGGGTHDHPQ